MPDLVSLIQQGASNLWIFISTSIILGALHGLEPGHSKTMMAAFIIAIRGTIAQAVLLGLTATISHTAVVWLIASAGMYFLGGKIDAETTEPYFQLISGALIVGLAIWMMYRSWRHQRSFRLETAHHHHNESQTIDRGHAHGHSHNHDHKHGHHHDQGHAHEHIHEHSPELAGLEVTSPGYQDAHELAHANDIRRRFTNQNVTTKQIIFFGITGGLIPCPASVTVLLLCLQLKRLALGALLVTCFSIGLALTMVVSGVIAAISVRQVTKRWSGFSSIARKAPYLSGTVILIIGLYIAYGGLKALF